MKRGKWNQRLSDEDRIRLSKIMGREIKYRCPEEIPYFSKRYNKKVTVPNRYMSDGATNVPDLNTRAWWVHDILCDRGTFDDDTKCTNWQASCILRDILWEDGFWFRSNLWLFGTWFGGGGKARKNGMW